VNDDGLQALIRRGPDRSLDGLEADIWAGVEARVRDRRRGAVLVGGQLALMAVAVAGSLNVGSATVVAQERRRNSSALLASVDLAPSTLLSGR